MSFRMNRTIDRFSRELGLDYIVAFGLYAALEEIEAEGIIDELNDDRFLYELGYMSHELSHKLSQLGRDKIWDIYRDIKRDTKRDNERDRKRTQRAKQREAENATPDGSSSPTPPISPLPLQESKRDINNINNAPTRTRERKLRTRFVRPTEPELSAYAKELGYDSFNAGRFLDYYDANGWTVGKDKPMKDWKAAVRTWKRNDDERRGITAHAEPRRDTDEDLFAGFTPEEIELVRQIAQDGNHWG